MKRRLLNVGGNLKALRLPAHFDGWEHHLLDIDPKVQPDILCDARQMGTLPGESYDAIYCSHNLEHYYRHDLPKVLAGFVHVLKPDGFAQVRVPDMKAVFEAMLAKNLDIDDTLYTSTAGPISVNDVIYGYGREIAESGQDFFAHRNGFTHRSLVLALSKAGFPLIFTGSPTYEISALAFKREPGPETRAFLGLPPLRST
jgi:SAM-dependent methyltransferase